MSAIDIQALISYRMEKSRESIKAAELIRDDIYNVMVAIKRTNCVPVPLQKVAGRVRTVPMDHPWIQSARMVGTCLGDGRRS